MRDCPGTGRPGVLRTPGRDRGGVGVEYLALVVLAAVILGALVAGGVPDSSRTRDAICRIVHSRDCGTPSSRRASAADDHPGTASPDTTQAPKPKNTREPEPDHKDDCDGFLGCARHYLKKTGPVFGVFAGISHAAAADLRAMFRTVQDPELFVDGLKYAIDHPGETGAEMFIDDGVRYDWNHGDYAKAVGRFLHNTTGAGLPIGRGMDTLNRLGELERAGRVSPKYKQAIDLLERIHEHQAEVGSNRFSAAEARALLARYERLTAAERTKFIDEMTPQELLDFVDDAAWLGHGADPLADASPKALKASGGALNPAFKDSGGWKPFEGNLFGKDGAKVSDVIRGELGSCACLSSMGATANADPASIPKMFTENPNGTVTVKFGDGKWVTVTRDLPVNGARIPESGAGWPAIMEKALAQRHGGYAGIHGGDPAKALTEITGYTSHTVSGSKIPELSEMRANMLEKKTSQVVAFLDDVRLKDAANREIFADHGYAVVDVDPVKHTVTLANPDGPSKKPVTLTEEELHQPGVILVHA